VTVSDRVGREPSTFQVHAVAHHYDAIKRQTRFRAIPRNELIDRKLIHAARTRRREAVEYGHFGMVEIGQSEYDPTIVHLGFWLSHAGGLLSPQHGIKAQRLVRAKSSYELFWTRNWS
jgi:hypothetical protein